MISTRDPATSPSSCISNLKCESVPRRARI